MVESHYKQQEEDTEGDPFYKLTEEDLAPGPKKGKRMAIPVKYDKNGLPLPSTIKVVVEKIFKGDDTLKAKKGDLIEINIQYPWNYKFYEGKKYLMSGRVIRNKPYINMCDWNSPWKDITYVQTWGLQRYYEKNCQCKMVSEANYTPQKDKCKWQVLKSDCQSKNGICIYFQKHKKCMLYIPKLPCVDPENVP